MVNKYIQPQPMTLRYAIASKGHSLIAFKTLKEAIVNLFDMLTAIKALSGTPRYTITLLGGPGDRPGGT